MSKTNYTIRARNKAGKILVTEHVSGYISMLKERGHIYHQKLRKHWYRITVDETRSSSASGEKKLALIVRKNSEASRTRAYEVYSIYNKADGSQYTSTLYRNKTKAQGDARDIMAGYNSRLGHLKQGSL